MKFNNNHTSLLGLIIATSVSLTGCSELGVGPKLGIKIPLEERADEDYINAEKAAQKREEEIKFSQLENDKPKSDKKKLKKKSFIGSGQFVSKKSKRGGTEQQEKPSGEGKYSLNFDAADLGEVAKIILSDMLQVGYIISPKVAGTVSLQTTEPLHKEELLPTLEMLLRINGAVLIKRDGLYRIEPEALGAQMSGASGMTGKKLKAGYQIKVIPLKYVGAIDMSEILAPILPAKSIIKVDPTRNILLVAGTGDELRKAMDLVDTFDVNFIKGMSFGLYSLENSDAASTVTEIENIFNGGEKSPLTGMMRFISIKNLNAILVVTQQKEYLKEAEKWITRLDEESGESASEGGLIVYRVQHVDAVELAGTLSEIIGGSSSSSRKPPSLAPGQKLGSLSNKKRDPKQKKTKNRRNTASSSGQGSDAFEGVTIIADEPNNALVIKAQSQQYRMLKKVIKQLDVMPLQVLLEAKIISVDLTDGLDYGVGWTFGHLADDKRRNSDNFLNEFAQAALDVATGAFTYGIVDSDGIMNAELKLLATNEKVDVISSPSLMVLNNKEGHMRVGNSVPRKTSEASENTNGATVPAGISEAKTGVDLTVTPRVNANGVVIMDIIQEVNDVAAVGTNTGSSIDSPTIFERKIESSVAVIDGESVVLGGLMDETHTDSNNGIPLLKDIPYVGWLFGTQVHNVVKKELIVIITPRVIEDKFDARKVTDEFKRKLSGIFYDRNEYTPGWGENKRDSHGRVISDDTYKRDYGDAKVNYLEKSKNVRGGGIHQRDNIKRLP